MLLSPKWDRACGDCRRWLYRDDDETPAEHRGAVMVRLGKPLPRPATVPPPCFKCPKVPAGIRAAKREAGAEVTPADAVEPDEIARAVVAHFLACDAARTFPDDPIVRRHAGIIRPYAEAAAARPIQQLISLVVAAMGRRG
jgi:hypothetical protein